MDVTLEYGNTVIFSPFCLRVITLVFWALGASLLISHLEMSLLDVTFTTHPQQSTLRGTRTWRVLLLLLFDSDRARRDYNMWRTIYRACDNPSRFLPIYSTLTVPYTQTVVDQSVRRHGTRGR